MWEKGSSTRDESESTSRGVIRKEESLYLLERSRGTMVILSFLKKPHIFILNKKKVFVWLSYQILCL